MEIKVKADINVSVNGEPLNEFLSGNGIEDAIDIMEEIQEQLRKSYEEIDDDIGGAFQDELEYLEELEQEDIDNGEEVCYYDVKRRCEFEGFKMVFEELKNENM